MSEKTQILIRDVPKDVVESLDKIVKEDKYQSRNQLLIEIIERYISVKNEYFYGLLPSIVRSICLDELSQFTDISKSTVHTISLAAQRLLTISQRLDEYLIDDNEAQAEYREIEGLIEKIGEE